MYIFRSVSNFANMITTDDLVKELMKSENVHHMYISITCTSRVFESVRIFRWAIVNPNLTFDRISVDRHSREILYLNTVGSAVRKKRQIT